MTRSSLTCWLKSKKNIEFIDSDIDGIDILEIVNRAHR